MYKNCYKLINWLNLNVKEAAVRHKCPKNELLCVKTCAVKRCPQIVIIVMFCELWSKTMGEKVLDLFGEQTYCVYCVDHSTSTEKNMLQFKIFCYHKSDQWFNQILWLICNRIDSFTLGFKTIDSPIDRWLAALLFSPVL